MKSTKVAAEDIDKFQEDGAIVLRGVFSQEWIDAARIGIHKTMKNPSQYAEMLKPDPNQGGYFNDYCNWKKIPEVKKYVYNSPAAAIAGQLMKSPMR